MTSLVLHSKCRKCLLLECARAKDEAKGRLGVEFRCDDATGNYLPMQCHGSMCYCADAHGKQVGKSVPRQDSGSLSC